tara:strand:- start:2912 stop:3751 length:840 start_codon:yes stop_codon:yes gene_type:complete
MKYSSIRNLHYKTQRKIHIGINASIDDWLHSPYHCLKVRFFIELSAIIVNLLQHTPIKPNFITILFVITGIVGSILLSSGEQHLIVAGVLIFFTYGIFDWIDGLLARVKKKMSTLGSVLDPWAGLVASFSFSIGIGIYLFNSTQEIHFIYLTILIIAIKALDIKNYTYHYSMYSFYKNYKLKKNKNRKKNKFKKEDLNLPKKLIYLKNFFKGFLDDRAITIDTIGVIILIELSYDKIILTNFIYYLIFIRALALFAGGFYLVFFKDFAEKINSSLNKIS